ncbi:MAG: hypothetical protein EOP85_04170 [Verrucomicrobiaceae bacterium]|nr:MAG: hypothetical protein EOP85_04170 [Verrucomicrobiaceae bacterium]
MSRVVTRSSVRAANLKSELRSNITGAFFLSGVLLSMYSLWGDDLTRITNVDLSAAGTAAVCFLIGACRIGLIRR